jgi:hypothetical protein
MEVYETYTFRLAQPIGTCHRCVRKKKKGREIPSLLKINFIQKDRRDAFVPAKLC